MVSRNAVSALQQAVCHMRNGFGLAPSLAFINLRLALAVGPEGIARDTEVIRNLFLTEQGCRRLNT